MKTALRPHRCRWTSPRFRVLPRRTRQIPWYRIAYTGVSSCAIMGKASTRQVLEWCYSLYWRTALQVREIAALVKLETNYRRIWISSQTSRYPPQGHICWRARTILPGQDLRSEKSAWKCLALPTRLEPKFSWQLEHSWASCTIICMTWSRSFRSCSGFAYTMLGRRLGE